MQSMLYLPFLNTTILITAFKEILLVVVVILILFGAKKIPQLMQGIGRGIREFSDAKKNPLLRSRVWLCRLGVNLERVSSNQYHPIQNNL